jgi:long-subunit acyl-CoA synthetase (AMP-forming)
VETLPGLVREALSNQRADALLERSAGAWRAWSSDEVLERTERITRALRERCAPGDRVAIVSGNCVDWILTNFGILFARCVSVPIFPTQTPEHVAYIFADCDAKLVFADAHAAKRLQCMNLSIPIVQFEAQASTAWPRSKAAVRSCKTRSTTRSPRAPI